MTDCDKRSCVGSLSTRHWLEFDESAICLLCCDSGLFSFDNELCVDRVGGSVDGCGCDCLLAVLTWE